MGILDVPWDNSDVNEEGLYPIFDGSENRVRVPKVVKQFDITMRREDRDIEADYVFIVWLARKLSRGVFPDGLSDAIGRDEINLGVCTPSNIEKFEVLHPELGSLDIEDFFAELPDVEEYERGEENPQYQIDYVESAIRVINAKNACKSCPIRPQCLTESILLGDEDKEYGVNSNVRPLPGIWGGREMKDRKSIARKFKAIRNEYLSGNMPTAKKGMYERKARKFIDERTERD